MGLYGLLLADLQEAVVSKRIWFIAPHTAWLLIFGASLIFATGGGVSQARSTAEAYGLASNAQSADQLLTYVPKGAQNDTDTDMRTDAWIYPDAPGALAALQDGRQLYAVKAEFLHVNDDGTLQEIDQSDSAPNGYSPANVALMKAHSTEQYITVSGDMAGTQAAMQRSAEAIDTIAALANKTGFGVELDWEEFGQWTPDYYHSFKLFLRDLGSRLHADGHQLIIDGPPIYDANSQNWYQWKYEELAPLADNIVMMVYDNQYDTGVGNSIAPRAWTAACLNWLRDKAGDKAIAGIAAYGYSGDENSGRISVNSSDFILKRITSALGSLLATRNSDGELTARVEQTFYDYSDRQTMDTRLQEVQASGITRLSVWSLGDNPWF